MVSEVRPKTNLHFWFKKCSILFYWGLCNNAILSSVSPQWNHTMTIWTLHLQNISCLKLKHSSLHWTSVWSFLCDFAKICTEYWSWKNISICIVIIISAILTRPNSISIVQHCILFYFIPVYSILFYSLLSHTHTHNLSELLKTTVYSTRTHTQ